MRYIYRALVKSVYDGDTLTVDIDLGLKTWAIGVKVRLKGIDAPELRLKEREVGLAARDFLRELLPVGSPVTIETYKDRTGKYGRYIADVYIPYTGPDTDERQNGELLSVAEIMLENGFAEASNY